MISLLFIFHAEMQKQLLNCLLYMEKLYVFKCWIKQVIWYQHLQKGLREIVTGISHIFLTFFLDE